MVIKQGKKPADEPQKVIEFRLYILFLNRWQEKSINQFGRKNEQKKVKVTGMRM